MLGIILLVLGLAVFESISSVDNAIINAHILKTMSRRARFLFLIFGVGVAVFAMRGLLPILMVWMLTSQTSFWSLTLDIFLGRSNLAGNIGENARILLFGGGPFLILIYLHWLFREEKDPYFLIDKVVNPARHKHWFYAAAALLIVLVSFAGSSYGVATVLAAVAGNAIFYILHGFREDAEKMEGELAASKLNDRSKLFFLILLDASFSIDGVVGAFAFTQNVSLIFWGNGLGAMVVAVITFYGIERIGRYRWLKNGAMTSIGFLGIFMVLHGMDAPIPEFLPVVITLVLVCATFWSSHRYLKQTANSN